jgi:hypothetical protein
MFCISNPRADRGKLVPFLESSGHIYPETGLTFEAPKCVLASVIIIIIGSDIPVQKAKERKRNSEEQCT